MILDALLRACEAQQITADAVSENTIDLGNVTPKRKIAVGEPMCFVMTISALGTTTGSSKIQAIQSAAANLGSAQIIGQIDLAAADHAVGKIYIIPIAQGTAALRYVGLNFDITGTVDYTVDAFLTSQKNASILAESYAKGYTV